MINVALVLNKQAYSSHFNVHTLSKTSFNPFYHGSALIFIKTIEGFYFVKEYSIVNRYQDEPMMYIFYIFDASFDSLQNSQVNFYKKLALGRESMFHYSYFLIDEGDVISLLTFEWFKGECNQLELVRLNTFEKFSLKWTSKLEAHEKFLDFNGCELVMALPYPCSKNGCKINRFHWGYSIFNKDRIEFSVKGISPKVFNIASKKFNFKDGYWPVRAENLLHLLDARYKYEILLLKKNTSYKQPLIYFDISSVSTNVEYNMRMATVFNELKFTFLVTPDKSYTHYEKLILPFDMYIWIYLSLTFFMTFLTIFVINRLSKSVQFFIIGKIVKNPLLNVISIFFGIPQTRLPAESFSRIILLLFTFLCLIFRIYYQGLLYKFIKNEPKRAPPKSIQDLVDRNYSIFTPYMTHFQELIEFEVDKW